MPRKPKPETAISRLEAKVAELQEVCESQAVAINQHAQEIVHRDTSIEALQDANAKLARETQELKAENERLAPFEGIANELSWSLATTRIALQDTLADYLLIAGHKK